MRREELQLIAYKLFTIVVKSFIYELEKKFPVHLTCFYQSVYHLLAYKKSFLSKITY